jgi:hypothetical protein
MAAVHGPVLASRPVRHAIHRLGLLFVSGALMACGPPRTQQTGTSPPQPSPGSSAAAVAASAAPDPQSTSASAGAGQTTLVIDFAGVDAWLACLHRTPVDLPGCGRVAEQTTGGIIARLAEASFGDEPPPAIPSVSADRVAKLVAEMRAWHSDGIIAEVQGYLPQPARTTIDARVVANGHPWGDAYVRTIKQDAAGPMLSPDGEPVILFNAVVIAATYPGTPEEQAADALGVLKHETFHALFHRYREGAPSWRQLPQQLDPAGQLLLTVLDEGIAHFIGDRSRLLKDGFPADRGKKAIGALDAAMQRLRALPADSSESKALLQSANQGRYWNKFGSISGMLFAYGVFRADGMEGLREAVRCGPGRLLASYARAAASHADLLPLSKQILDEAKRLDLCAVAARTRGGD